MAKTESRKGSSSKTSARKDSSPKATRKKTPAAATATSTRRKGAIADSVCELCGLLNGAHVQGCSKATVLCGECGSTTRAHHESCSKATTVDGKSAVIDDTPKPPHQTTLIDETIDVPELLKKLAPLLADREEAASKAGYYRNEVKQYDEKIDGIVAMLAKRGHDLSEPTQLLLSGAAANGGDAKP